jgi:hypothetical protein
MAPRRGCDFPEDFPSGRRAVQVRV